MVSPAARALTNHSTTQHSFKCCGTRGRQQGAGPLLGLSNANWVGRAPDRVPHQPTDSQSRPVRLRSLWPRQHLAPSDLQPRHLDALACAGWGVTTMQALQPPPAAPARALPSAGGFRPLRLPAAARRGCASRPCVVATVAEAANGAGGSTVPGGLPTAAAAVATVPVTFQVLLKVRPIRRACTNMPFACDTLRACISVEQEAQQEHCACSSVLSFAPNCHCTPTKPQRQPPTPQAGVVRRAGARCGRPPRAGQLAGRDCSQPALGRRPPLDRHCGAAGWAACGI